MARRRGQGAGKARRSGGLFAGARTTRVSKSESRTRPTWRETP
jgi:hypothetical protein